MRRLHSSEHDKELNDYRHTDRQHSRNGLQDPDTDPESDGTIEWDQTTLVLVRLSGGGTTGLGYSYADLSSAQLIPNLFASKLVGLDAFATAKARQMMTHAIRNLGRPGIASVAIAAVDTALWDLKARLLGLSAANLLGAVRSEILGYGSGGFTSYSPQQLTEQLGGWQRTASKQ